MTIKNSEILIKRLKSFAWRAGMMVAVAGVAAISNNLNVFEFNPAYVPFISLVLSEVTKYLNNKLSNG